MNVYISYNYFLKHTFYINSYIITSNKVCILDILRCILTGNPINYNTYEGIISKDGSSFIVTDFFILTDRNKYKVNQLGTINGNQIIPINVHKMTENEIMQAVIPLAMDGVTEIPQKEYEQVQAVIDAINIAIKSVIPNLQICLEDKLELERPDGRKVVQVALYSKREEKKFLLKYESEGIKRIISILNYLISVYNNEGVCLVVDELDSGIFEYLLGELLGVMYGDMKGQLIFTSHNLRVLEKLDSKNIICSTINPNNRYIRLKGVERNHNKRDFYIRAITVGGQNEELYDEDDLDAIGYAFRKAGRINAYDKYR